MAVYFQSEDQWPGTRWTGEVKAQRPIDSNEADPPILVYNKARSLFVHLKQTPALMASLFPDGEFKTYRVVTIVDKTIAWGQPTHTNWA